MQSKMFSADAVLENLLDPSWYRACIEAAILSKSRAIQVQKETNSMRNLSRCRGRSQVTDETSRKPVTDKNVTEDTIGKPVTITRDPAGPDWLQIWSITLKDEKNLYLPNAWLNDRIIDATQEMLKRQFPHIWSLDTCLKASNLSFKKARGNFVQVLNRDPQKVVLTG